MSVKLRKQISKLPRDLRDLNKDSHKYTREERTVAMHIHACENRIRNNYVLVTEYHNRINKAWLRVRNYINNGNLEDCEKQIIVIYKNIVQIKRRINVIENCKMFIELGKKRLGPKYCKKVRM